MSIKGGNSQPSHASNRTESEKGIGVCMCMCVFWGILPLHYFLRSQILSPRIVPSKIQS